MMRGTLTVDTERMLKGALMVDDERGPHGEC